MMSPRYCIRFLVIMAAAAALGLPDIAAGSPATEPIVITSDSLSAHRGRSTALFEGSVVARGDGMVLSAERMTAFYGPDQAVTSIVAEGSVKLVKGLQVLTSGRAVYEVSARMMTFTEGPRAVDEGRVMIGATIVYFLDDERITVEKSTLIINSAGTGGAGE